MTIQSGYLLECLRKDLLAAGLPHEGGSWWPDISIREAAALSLMNAFTKKLVTRRGAHTERAALDKFEAVNKRCLEWRADGLTSKTETLIGLLRRNLDKCWHRFNADFGLHLPIIDDPRQILDEARLGPGVNVEANGTSFYSKLFSSKLSCSDPSLYNWYKLYVSKIPEWHAAEMQREATYGGPYISPSSRLSFVPKNDEIDRVICIEPTLNTFFQLGIGRILEGRLHERFGIALSEQPFVNRDLARLGSITDGLATLDLSSASDSLSMSMLQYVLPTGFYSLLCKYRCQSVEIKGRGTVQLNMVSTMGNGFNFPLQTMLFACVVVSCFEFRGIPLTRDRSDRLWSVFGDDIIVPIEIYGDVVQLLTFLGFVLNHDKSFEKGPFRESCGADFFRGVDIRGVYLKRVDTEASRYCAINQLIRFSSRTGIWLEETISALLNTVRPLFVPPWSDVSCGIHVPKSLAPKKRDKNGAIVYYTLERRPSYIRLTDEGTVVVPRGHVPLMYNSSGLLISLLHGEVNCSRIATRNRGDRFNRRRRVEPSWGEIAPSGPLASTRDRPDYGVDWCRWESDVLAYLKK